MTTNGNGKKTPATTTTLDTTGWMEFQAVGTTTADGFWNIPREQSEADKFKGERLAGILVAKVTTSKGRPLDNPFFIFELLEDHARASLKGEDGKTTVGTLKAGQRIGVSAGWKALSNLDKYLGYGFVLTFQGKQSFPGGRVANAIKVVKSPKALREIEQLHPAKVAEGDQGGEGESVPWD